LIVALIIAVVLFAAVPSSAAIKVPIALGGAAAFFFVILPRIEPFIFPTFTVTGTIYYVGTTQPVVGVTVRDPDTNQSATTNENGDFTLPNVSRRVTKLTAKSGGVDVTFDLTAEKKYPIIKQAAESPRTTPQPLGTTGWSEKVRSGCPTEKDSVVKLFLLKNEHVPLVQGYPKVYVQVALRGGGNIVHAETLKPAPQDVHEVDSEPQKRQWWWKSGPGPDLDFQIAICAATKKNAPVATLNEVEANYWFEKE